MRRADFRAASLLTLASAIALSVAFPSTSTCSGEPAGRHPAIHDPPGGGCSIDRLMTIRLAIVAVGVVAAWVLTVLGARRSLGDKSAPAPV